MSKFMGKEENVTEQKKELSSQIKHQFDLGSSELIEGDKYLFKKGKGYTLKPTTKQTNN